MFDKAYFIIEYQTQLEYDEYFVLDNNILEENCTIKDIIKDMKKHKEKDESEKDYIVRNLLKEDEIFAYYDGETTDEETCIKYLKVSCKYALVYVENDIIIRHIINPNIKKDFIYRIYIITMTRTGKNLMEDCVEIPEGEMFHFAQFLYSYGMYDKMIINGIKISDRMFSYTINYDAHLQMKDQKDEICDVIEEFSMNYFKIFGRSDLEKWNDVDIKELNNIIKYPLAIKGKNDKPKLIKMITDEFEIKKEWLRIDIIKCLKKLGVYDFLKGQKVFIGGSLPAMCLTYADKSLNYVLSRIGDIDIYPKDSRDFFKQVDKHSKIDWDTKRIKNYVFRDAYRPNDVFSNLVTNKSFEFIEEDAKCLCGYESTEEIKKKLTNFEESKEPEGSEEKKGDKIMKRMEFQIITSIFKKFEDVLESYDSTIIQIGYDVEKDEIVTTRDFDEDYKKKLFREYPKLSQVTKHKDRSSKFKKMAKAMKVELEESFDKETKSHTVLGECQGSSYVGCGGSSEICKNCEKRNKKTVYVANFIDFNTNSLYYIESPVLKYKDIFPWKYSDEYLKKNNGKDNEMKDEKNNEEKNEKDNEMKDEKDIDEEIEEAIKNDPVL